MGKFKLGVSSFHFFDIKLQPTKIPLQLQCTFKPSTYSNFCFKFWMNYLHMAHFSLSCGIKLAWFAILQNLFFFFFFKLCMFCIIRAGLGLVLVLLPTPKILKIVAVCPQDLLARLQSSLRAVFSFELYSVIRPIFKM